MADIVFAFDPAIDRPVPAPDGAPQPIVEAIAAAPLESLRIAAATARDSRAAALVLFGRVLDPHRASPAQAAALRAIIVDLSAAGCHTVWVTDDAAPCDDIARMVGEPRGLLFATPLAPAQLDIRGLPVEIVCGRGEALALPAALPSGLADGPIAHRVIVTWDTALWTAERWDDAAAEPTRPPAGWLQPGCHCVWGSRRPTAVAPGLRHVPPLQPRSAHETTAGGCSVLSLVGFVDDGGHDDPSAGTGRWRSVATQRVGWNTLTVESSAGGDEELAATIWSALESLPVGPHSPLQIIHCSVECGTSVARRVRVGIGRAHV